MNRINFDEEIRLHNLWRRQFMNAFAAGSYADMPLSGHRSCTLAAALKAADGPCARQPLFRLLAVEHDRFHALCALVGEHRGQRHTGRRGQRAGFVQPHGGGIHRRDGMALARQPDAVAAFAVAGHEDAAGGGQPCGLRAQEGVGFGAVFVARLGKALVPEVHGVWIFSWIRRVVRQTAQSTSGISAPAAISGLTGMPAPLAALAPYSSRLTT